MKLTELIIPTDSKILTKGIRRSLTLFLFLITLNGPVRYFILLSPYLLLLNPRTYTPIHTPTVAQEGGGWMEPLPGVFNILQYFETILPLVENLWSSYKMRYILGVLALLEACDVIYNGRHFGRNLGFYQEKPTNGNFLCFTWKITHKKTLGMIIATRFTFIVERGWKNMYFHPKLAWPPATYDVVSRNHSNWPSLNLSQNVRKGWMNSYWKRQVLMFYPLGKNSEKPCGRWRTPCTS